MVEGARKIGLKKLKAQKSKRKSEEGEVKLRETQSSKLKSKE